MRVLARLIQARNQAIQLIVSGLVVQGVEISRPLQGISGKWTAGPVPLHEQQHLVRAMAAIIALTGKAVLPKLSPTTCR